MGFFAGHQRADITGAMTLLSDVAPQLIHTKRLSVVNISRLQPLFLQFENLFTLQMATES